MFLGIATLAVAIVISVVAAYYSILGLTAIFAAAFWPIVIMGGALETGKLMTAVWLHRNWKRASWAYKWYLVPALAFLMLLTSMGIFGFLSKAHLDQTVPTGDVAAQVALIDEKIKNERDTIVNARALIKQLDDAVTGINASADREVKRRDGSTYTQSGAERALAVRRSQARDRAALTKTIDEAQATIVKLQEQKAPIAKDLRKIEAEVGPVKYVAALIYGDNPDTNTLEKAVRWVIILIVLVFDPLAIVLILAGSKQIEWARGINFEAEDHHREVMRQKAIKDEEVEAQRAQAQQQSEKDIADIETANALAQEAAVQESVDAELIAKQARDIEELEQKHQEYLSAIEIQQGDIDQKSRDISLLESAVQELTRDIRSLESLNEKNKSENSDLTKQLESSIAKLEAKDAAITELKQQQEDLLSAIEAAQQAADQALAELELARAKKTAAVPAIEPAPDFSPIADNIEAAAAGEAGFGGSFPAAPNKGDLFLRVDYLPSKLFKWNGAKWIEIDKKLTDSYTYNERYIEHLVERLDKGEYDADDLSDNEKEQVEAYIQRHKNA